VPPRTLALTLTTLAALAATSCREPRAWSAPGWRPAAPPQRIVAASVFATEVLLEIAPRERIAAVHVLAADPRYSVVAAAARGLPAVGAEPEQLLAVAPDLVVCDAFTRPETLALLGAADVPVVRTASPAGFADIAANVRHVGRLCHLEAEAERLVARMDEQLRALATRAPELAAWRIANLDGALHTHGRGSLFAAVATAAGARSIAAEHGVGPFRKLELETLLAWQPDALVVGGEPLAGGELPAWLRQRPGLGQLACVARGRLVQLPGPLLGSTSHLLAGAAQRLQQELLRRGPP
jgi:iron complex transport system substrate-binding protein